MKHQSEPSHLYFRERDASSPPTANPASPPQDEEEEEQEGGVDGPKKARGGHCNFPDDDELERFSNERGGRDAGRRRKKKEWDDTEERVGSIVCSSLMNLPLLHSRVLVSF